MAVGALILKNFKSYYYTLLKKMELALSSGMKEDIETVVTQLQSDLQKILYEQIKYASNHFAGIEMRYIERGIYLEAALSDELFLRTQWKGHELWKNMMLEHHIFNSQNAGNRIFEEIEDIINTPHTVPSELIQVYYYLLCMGLQGEQNEDTLRAYKNRLLGLLYPTTKFLFSGEQHYLMPNVFHCTYEQKPSRFLMDVKSWLMIFLAVIASYVVISTYFWYATQSDVARIAHELAWKTRNKRLA